MRIRILIIGAACMTVIAGGAQAQNVSASLPTSDPTTAYGGNAANNLGNSTIQIGHKYVTAPSVTYQDYRTPLSRRNAANPVSPNDLQSSGGFPIDPAQTASHLIGVAVRDEDGKPVGTVSDITINAGGQGQKLIVIDNGYFGTNGKPVAVNFSALQPVTDGNAALRELLNPKSGAVTGYDKNADTGVTHVANLLGGALKGPSKETEGQVNDVVFTGTQVSELVLSFQSLIGVGGNMVVMSFADANVVAKGNSGTYVQLDAHQAATLAGLRKATQ